MHNLFLFLDAMKIVRNEIVIRRANQLNKEEKMEHNANKRITYAASYALLKRCVDDKVITPDIFDMLNERMAECQMCDLLVSHHCEKTEKA